MGGMTKETPLTDPDRGGCAGKSVVEAGAVADQDRGTMKPGPPDWGWKPFPQ